VIGLLVAAVAGPVRADPATDGAVLRAQLVALSATVARYEQWSSCLRVVTVRERGDPMGSDGYRFDAGDGTGISYRTALALAPGAAAAADTYDLLDVRDDGTCVGLRASPAIGTDRKSLRAAVRRVALAVHRFDAWESCLTPIAVSEFGDADGRFGYEVGASGGRTRWRAAISVDRTDPEDPDYLLFAQQRGEACAKDDDAESATGADGLSRDGLVEDVADLVDPVADLARFDSCMYTVGIVQHPGYRFGAGGRRTLPALSLAVRGRRAGHQLLAFPPEEPPGVECDEDHDPSDDGDDRDRRALTA
jgi:hypothetical protein